MRVARLRAASAGAPTQMGIGRWIGSGQMPAAVTVFPGEIYQAPRTWADRAYHDLVYWNEVGTGGHFAAWEQPALFSQEVRAAFRSLR